MTSTIFATPPSRIVWKSFSFLILDAPNQNNLHLYIKEMRNHQVTHVVRACEPTYSREQMEAAGIAVHEMEFQDGESPGPEIIDQWLDLVQATFPTKGEPKETIAVHCVAGLGRAPVLVAIALIEHGVDPINAVELIRKHRRGAINLRQLKYLEKYEPRRLEKAKCIIM